MLFDLRDQERIGIFNEELRTELSIGVRTSADPRSPQFEAFAAEFSAFAPKVRFVPTTADQAAPPAILIGEAWCYHAIPLSAELDPLLHLLQLLNGSEPPPNPSLRGRLQTISIPGSLQVFIASHCPFCPQVVKQIVALPLCSPLLRVTVIDGALFPEMAQTSEVRSAPTTILDGEFRWTGQVNLEELVDVLVLRDATRLDQTALVDMLKEGNASQIAQMMVRRQVILPAFLPLLEHAEWSVRLGAMVTLEEIAELDPKLAKQTVGAIWQIMESAPDSIRGDLVYLLGQLGDVGSIERLQRMLTVEASDELREVLEEALATLAPEDL